MTTPKEPETLSSSRRTKTKIRNLGTSLRPARRRLAVVIVNYRTPHFFVHCLSALEGQVDHRRDIVVIVDNGSDDGSDRVIQQLTERRGWQQWIRLERSPANRGFSAGNNIGINKEHADYYLLMNSDTIARRGSVAEMLGIMEGRRDVGLVSPRLEWLDGTPQASCFRRRTPIDEFFIAAGTGLLETLVGRTPRTLPVSDQPIEPDWVSFACVMIRRNVFERIGLLDQDYFMYYDDMDFCRRAWAAGFRTLHWPKARVVHLRGGSGPAKRLSNERKRPPRYVYASRSRYYAKFYGTAGLWLANLMWWAGWQVSLVREVVGHKRPHACHKQWCDIWTNWRQPLKPPLASEA